jgi:hypothetical protein
MDVTGIEHGTPESQSDTHPLCLSRYSRWSSQSYLIRRSVLGLRNFSKCRNLNFGFKSKTIKIVYHKIIKKERKNVTSTYHTVFTLFSYVNGAEITFG